MLCQGSRTVEPKHSCLRKLVNRSEKPAVVPQEQLITHIVAINTYDSEEFNCLWSMGRLTEHGATDVRSPHPVPP